MAYTKLRMLPLIAISSLACAEEGDSNIWLVFYCDIINNSYYDEKGCRL